VIEVEDKETARELFADLPHRIIGRTTDDKQFRTTLNGGKWFDCSMDELKAAWKQPLEEVIA
jgi:hypothetical protein